MRSYIFLIFLAGGSLGNIMLREVVKKTFFTVTHRFQYSRVTYGQSNFVMKPTSVNKEVKNYMSTEHSIKFDSFKTMEINSMSMEGVLRATAISYGIVFGILLGLGVIGAGTGLGLHYGLQDNDS